MRIAIKKGFNFCAYSRGKSDKYCIKSTRYKVKVKSRWACLPLDFRFYLMRKDIEAESATAKRQGKTLPFESKMEQAATMLKDVHNYFQQSVLIVTDSWFGNNGLWSRLDRGGDGCFHLLSRLRTNITLYDFAPAPSGKREAGRPKKYGKRIGSVDDCAALWKERTQAYTTFLYGAWAKPAKIFCQDVAANGGLRNLKFRQ